MKVYLDENMPPFVAVPLAQVYHGHEFRTPDDEDLRGVQDVELLQTLRGRGFDVIVTRDANQLKNPDERQAVAASGLRWVGVSDRRLRGLEQVTITTATLIAGLRYVFEHEPEEPTSYQLLTIPHTLTQRVRMRVLAA